MISFTWKKRENIGEEEVLFVKVELANAMLSKNQNEGGVVVWGKRCVCFLPSIVFFIFQLGDRRRFGAGEGPTPVAQMDGQVFVLSDNPLMQLDDDYSLLPHVYLTTLFLYLQFWSVLIFFISLFHIPLIISFNYKAIQSSLILKNIY